MNVSQDREAYAAKHTNTVLDRAVPIEVDTGLLAAFDNTPVDIDEYSTNLNPHLLGLTLTSTQSLLTTLLTLPTHPSALGPLIHPLPPTTPLPREKPLPKPKPETKWERFAKAKGMSHKKREKDEWDEETQEWVSRYGRGGKNREGEEQWLHEVKPGEDADLDPAASARTERKGRIAKNAKQAAANLSRAASSKADPTSAPKKDRDARKSELERSMLISSTSTASLGKFDKRIEGEPKVRGVKRKFESNVSGEGWDGEKKAAMGALAGVGKRKVKGTKIKGGQGEEGGLNVRKAVRFQAREERARGGGGGGGRGRGSGRGRGRGRGK